MKYVKIVVKFQINKRVKKIVNDLNFEWNTKYNPAKCMNKCDAKSYSTT